jgi:hypothetical protein
MSQPPRRSAATKRSTKVSQGAVGISSATTRPSSCSRRVWRRKLWNSEAVVSTRSVLPSGRHEYRRVTNSWVLGAKATWRGSESFAMRAMCACAFGTTSPNTFSHFASASALESAQ